MSRNADDDQNAIGHQQGGDTSQNRVFGQQGPNSENQSFEDEHGPAGNHGAIDELGQHQQGDQHEAPGDKVIDKEHNDGGFVLTDNHKTPHLIQQQQVGNVDNQHSGAGGNNEVVNQHPDDSFVFADNHKDSFVFTDKATAPHQQQIENFDNQHSAGGNNEVIDNHNLGHDIPSHVFHDDFSQVTDLFHPASTAIHHDLFS